MKPNRSGIEGAGVNYILNETAGDIMKKWRDASTVIIAARNINGQKQHGTDYKILTGRRNVESKFMPNSHVFPGGALDKNDSSNQWESLFSSLGFKNNLNDVIRPNNKLQIFDKEADEYLNRHVTLRIAAIRETFEECGILLCRKPTTQTTDLFGNFIDDIKNIEELQENLRKNKLTFYDLCKNLQCFPDIWALHESRNWLTPENLPKRFDTSFFLICLDNIPKVIEDKREVTDTRWTAPAELLRLHGTGELWLPPPQLYEMNKLSKYDTLNSLVIAGKQGKFTCERCYLPRILPLSDGLVFALPGDSNYDDDPSTHVNDTLLHLRTKAKVLRRYERPTEGTDSFFETAGDSHNLKNKY